MDSESLEALLEAACVGLEHYARQGDVNMPATQRLAFRVLGLVIGLHAVARLSNETKQAMLHARLKPLKALLTLGTEIESFWHNPDQQ